MNILVVEDEPKAGNYLLNGLQELGYSVSLARDGVDGLHQALETPFDVIVLDVMMPKMDGWEVLRRLRKEADTPVLFLTARDDIADRIKGLELGADDYLIKPFSFAELVARLRTLTRRGPSREEENLQIADADALGMHGQAPQWQQAAMHHQVTDHRQYQCRDAGEDIDTQPVAGEHCGALGHQPPGSDLQAAQVA